MVAFADKPLLHFASPGEWEAFLENDPPDGGVRLQLLRKGDDRPGITPAEALDIALCHGWIDGQAGASVDGYRVQSYSPRRARSPWSQINQGHVERLIAAGRMRPTGQAEIDRAKADGRWDAAYRQKDAPVPDDLRAALDANPAAAAFFETLGSQNRFAILFRIGNVKRAETRARKIAEFVAMCERGETLH
ncbi:MAG TPA: YdeI/OmpD-associated family protein [Pseudolysinimonas sp.]|nr:YdeI/OmpD-associated family protein [Pseudolysinimonas sp.]